MLFPADFWLYFGLICASGVIGSVVVALLAARLQSRDDRGAVTRTEAPVESPAPEAAAPREGGWSPRLRLRRSVRASAVASR